MNAIAIILILVIVFTYFYSAGTVENTGGAINKTSAKKHKAVKPEAQPISFAVGG
jgi:hypothetical protein